MPKSELKPPAGTSLSFRYEHGAFLSEEFLSKLGAEKGCVLAVESPNFVTYEVCRSLAEIDPRSEARALIAIFEDIVENHLRILGCLWNNREACYENSSAICL